MGQSHDKIGWDSLKTTDSLGSSFHSGIEFGRIRTCEGSSGGGEEGGGVRSGLGAARTFLLFHIISAWPP